VTEIDGFRRRDSNPSGDPFDKIGSDTLSADSDANSSGSDAPTISANAVEDGLSLLRCSNVASLVRLALDALAKGDLGTAQEALNMTLALVVPKTQ